MSEHTPTPWNLCKTWGPGDWPGIDGADGLTIIIFGSTSRETDDGGIRGATLDQALANAAFIVKAVNSHAALVEALKGMTRNYAGWSDAELQKRVDPPTFTAIKAAFAALALAGEAP